MADPKTPQAINHMGVKLPSTRLNDEQLITYLSDYLKNIPKDGTKIIALVAGPAGGKGTLASKLAMTLGRTAVLSTDNYLIGDRAYRRANIEDLGLDPLKKYDFNFLLEQVRQITKLQDDEEIGIPIYDGNSGVAISKDPSKIPDNSIYKEKVKGKQDFVIVEGDFQALPREFVDKIIYLDVDDNIRLQNRIYRDTQKRSATEDKIIANFNSRQETQFKPHTLPHKDIANLLIKVHAIPLESPTPETKFEYTYEVSEKQQ